MENDMNGVLKDDSDTWNNRLNQYIEGIDELREYLSFDFMYPNSNKPILYKINERITSLFSHIRNKMKKHCPMEIPVEEEFELFLDKLNERGIIRNRRIWSYEDGCPKSRYITTPLYYEYKRMLLKRERHIYDCMDIIGITSKDKEKSTRLM